MKGEVAIRNPTGKIVNDNSGNTITSGAPVVLDASLDQASSALLAFNTSAKAITLSCSKTVEGIAQTRSFCIPPATIGMLIPWEMYKGSSLSAQAVGADATTGFLVLNFMG